MRKFIFYFIIFFFVAKCYGQHDESKAADYTLPDVLKTIDGQIVNTVSVWENKRRTEVLTLFENNIYGQTLKSYDSIKFTLTNNVENALNGKARLKEVIITVWKSNKHVAIPLTVVIPNNSKKPSPLFLVINNGNKNNTDSTEKSKSDFGPVEMVIDSGYAIAAVYTGNAAPDNKETYQNGVLQLYPDQLNADNGIKAIGAWAWAASRAMDYFKTDNDVDFTKVGVVGHSRGGKTSLWAGAQDQRFAMVFSSCSGSTGAALARNQSGETVKAINTGFPHWFNNNYKKYNNDVNTLPVDQHMLIALIAPRPVYTTSATQDKWADPVGSYLSMVNAQKVYALYGKQSALTPDQPPPNTPILHSVLGYHIREGGHALTEYDWGIFIRFANFHYFQK
ncbi:MAG: acetylxylan esterase [Bacteroidota bacterium]